jgi:hypothetical protein
MVVSGTRRRVAVVVGAGFSAALTGTHLPMLGSAPLPTLQNLGGDLLSFARAIPAPFRGELDFADPVIAEAVDILQDNESRPVDERYDFEQLVSLVAIRRSLFASTLAERINPVPKGANPAVFRCLIALVGQMIAKDLGLFDTGRANRNYWYRVNDQVRATELYQNVRQIAAAHDVTFISFNYDGILEACLDFRYIGPGPTPDSILYLVERSHGLPMIMPEHIGGHDTRNFAAISEFPNLVTVLKPHGSIHFYRLRSGVEEVSGGNQITALHPRLDIGFDPGRQQRDIKDVSFWRWADSVPFIVPPLLSKENLLSSEYFREILRQMVEVLERAEVVISIGFSLPPSDLHICAAFELVTWTRKKLGLCFYRSPTDSTLQNWRRVARGANLQILTDRGLPTDSDVAIRDFWAEISRFIA